MFDWFRILRYGPRSVLELMMCMINNNIFNSISHNKCLQSGSCWVRARGCAFFSNRTYWMLHFFCYASVWPIVMSIYFTIIIIIFTLESLNSFKWICCSRSFSSIPRSQAIRNNASGAAAALHKMYCTFVSFIYFAVGFAIKFLSEWVSVRALFCLSGIQTTLSAIS